MIRKNLVVVLPLLVLFVFNGAHQARADVFLRSIVAVDPQSQQVGGISETYLSYDLTDYYDPIADGYLYYTNPTQTIDGEYGEGYDGSFYPPYFYGISVDFTTSNYQPNRILCTLTCSGLHTETLRLAHSALSGSL